MGVGVGVGVGVGCGGHSKVTQRNTHLLKHPQYSSSTMYWCRTLLNSCRSSNLSQSCCNIAQDNWKTGGTLIRRDQTLKIRPNKNPTLANDPPNTTRHLFNTQISPLDLPVIKICSSTPPPWE